MTERQTSRSKGNGESLARFAYAQIKGDILEKRVRSGERLREVELADSLGISRTPVREALSRLHSEGLLTVGPGGGLFIATTSPQEAVELYALREVLEGAAAEWSALYASNAEIELMREILARHTDTPATDSIALAAVNRKFHELLYHMAHNRYLLAVLTELQSSLALLPGTTYEVAGRREAAFEEHTQIIDAVARRDSSGARDAAQQHIRAAQRVRLAQMLDSD